MSDVNIDAFRLVTSPVVPKAVRAAPPRHRRDETFLAGGAPMWWLRCACASGKAALATGIALWFARGLRRGQPGPIKLNAAVRKQMGLSNDQAHRGLHALARGGLVAIARGGRGRCPEVEIITARPDLQEPHDAVTGGTVCPISRHSR
jgi:hypothetical protein